MREFSRVAWENSVGWGAKIRQGSAREFGGMAYGNLVEWHAKIQRGRARKLSGVYMRKFSGLTRESLVG
jgi:hypothetical protein